MYRAEGERGIAQYGGRNASQHRLQSHAGVNGDKMVDGVQKIRRIVSCVPIYVQSRVSLSHGRVRADKNLAEVELCRQDGIKIGIPFAERYQV